MTESNAICKRFFPLFSKTTIFLADETPNEAPRLAVASSLTAKRRESGSGGRSAENGKAEAAGVRRKTGKAEAAGVRRKTGKRESGKAEAGRLTEKKAVRARRVGKAGAALHFFRFSDIIKKRGAEASKKSDRRRRKEKLNEISPQDDEKEIRAKKRLLERDRK